MRKKAHCEKSHSPFFSSPPFFPFLSSPLPLPSLFLLLPGSNAHRKVCNQKSRCGTPKKPPLYRDPREIPVNVGPAQSFSLQRWARWTRWLRLLLNAITIGLRWKWIPQECGRGDATNTSTTAAVGHVQCADAAYVRKGGIDGARARPHVERALALHVHGVSALASGPQRTGVAPSQVSCATLAAHRGAREARSPGGNATLMCCLWPRAAFAPPPRSPRGRAVPYALHTGRASPL